MHPAHRTEREREREWGPKTVIRSAVTHQDPLEQGIFFGWQRVAGGHFCINYKNRGPFPPGKLNFHHKTSWPQTKKSILDHVIIRDNAVPPEAVAATVPHGSSATRRPVTRSNRSPSLPPPLLHANAPRVRVRERERELARLSKRTPA